MVFQNSISENSIYLSYFFIVSKFFKFLNDVILEQNLKKKLI